MGVWGAFQESLVAYDAYDMTAASHECTEPYMPHGKG